MDRQSLRFRIYRFWRVKFVSPALSLILISSYPLMIFGLFLGFVGGAYLGSYIGQFLTDKYFLQLFTSVLIAGTSGMLSWFCCFVY